MVEAFLQFTAGREAIKMDHPLISDIQRSREQAFRLACEAIQRFPYESWARMAHDSSIVISRVIQQALRSISAGCSSCFLRFDPPQSCASSERCCRPWATASLCSIDERLRKVWFG